MLSGDESARRVLRASALFRVPNVDPLDHGALLQPGCTLAIRGTRLSVALILECLANGMTLDDIDESFGRTFPREALSEVLKVASELAGAVHVAA